MASSRDPTREFRKAKPRARVVRAVPGEQSLLNRLPNQGSPELNWRQNAGVLRQEMKRGLPIGDKSLGDTGGQFLNAERYLLRDRGWTLDPATGRWMPPKK
jgi:hypothetical protein